MIENESDLLPMRLSRKMNHILAPDSIVLFHPILLSYFTNGITAISFGI